MKKGAFRSEGRRSVGDEGRPCESFGPVADDDVRVLILGSLPGERSLAVGEYYGHPQNRFWRVMAALTGGGVFADSAAFADDESFAGGGVPGVGGVSYSMVPATYDGKKAMLTGAGIGLWDVARRARREGSLDADIRDVEPNDIAGFVAAHPGLRVIAFNGRKAEALHDRFFDRVAGIEYLSLPSTSPANASCSLERLLEKWGRISDFL